MRALAVVLLASCGRIDFVHTDAAIDDAAVDVPSDALGPAALCGIPIAEAVVSAVAPLDEVSALVQALAPANLGRSEFDPVFSEDGLTLYFTSDQTFRFIVYRVTRPTLDAPFDTLVEMAADVNAAPNLHFGFQPLDSLGIAMIAAPYVDAAMVDFWRGTFDAGTWHWSPTILSTADGDGDARMSPEGLVVYFVRGAPDDARDIYRAQRADLAADFDPPALVAELNTSVSDAGPLPIRDGILFVSNRPGSTGEDIWYEPYGATPVLLTALAGPMFDGEPALFDRGGGVCDLVFVSNRGGAFDLYRATIQRMP